MQRDILLCDLDAFFASVEQRDNPELRGRPVIVGGPPGSRGVVSACSYEARAFGVKSAMAMKKALSLCPGAVVLPVDIMKYKAVSCRAAQILERFTPDIEQVSIDEAYLAVPSGKGIDIAYAIRAAVWAELDLPISIGVSSNKLLAKIACSLAKPNGVRSIWQHEVEAVLWPLAVRVLPGVGPVTEERLAKAGIKTVGDLISFPLAELRKIAGSFAFELKEYALGRDERELEVASENKSVSEETTFPRDVYERDEILATLYDFACELGYRLRSKGLVARTITLKLRFPDYTTKTKSVTLGEPIDAGDAIYEVASSLFLRFGGDPPWRLAGIRVSGLERERQLSFSFAGDPKERMLIPIMDSLRRKYGKEVLFKGKRLFLSKKRKGNSHLLC